MRNSLICKTAEKFGFLFCKLLSTTWPISTIKGRFDVCAPDKYIKSTKPTLIIMYKLIKKNSYDKLIKPALVVFLEAFHFKDLSDFSKII